MKVFAFVLLAMGLLALSSCSTTYRTATGSQREITPAPIVQNPLAVDLDISDKKVEGKYDGHNVTSEYAKNMAVSDALKRNNADVLVEPYYQIEVIGTHIVVTVKGYPAKYKNFRVPTLVDSIMLGLKAPIDNRHYNDSVYQVIKLETAGNTNYPGNGGVFRPTQISSTQANNLILNSDNLALYKSLKRKGNKQMIIGGGCLLLGMVFTIKGLGAYEDGAIIGMTTAGSILMTTGAIVLPIGAGNRVKASKLKSGMTLAFTPKLNLPTKTYQIGLALNF